ncbi:hypothetical protein EJ08DRAFT_735913 [Tothia fuscella]|uniref:C2H2-type domain-containing protein n=1 Tax=Tothia fuscella TaxID=1048955 RepID=A0A9P4TW64_9PEZI|nr:hypothetical protein EJ08DRAFT_735913 [Tothia fuscella]
MKTPSEFTLSPFQASGNSHSYNVNSGATTPNWNSVTNGQPRMPTSLADSSPQRLACPFSKHNPPRYEHVRACKDPLGFADPARVMEHCKKIHSSQYNCCICQKKYDGTSKAQIERSRVAHEKSECCRQQDFTRPEFMTSEQEKIFDRSEIQNGSKCAEEKWHLIYKYLFPYTEQFDQPPSPYYDYLIPRYRRDMLSDALHEHNTRLALEMAPTSWVVPELLSSDDSGYKSLDYNTSDKAEQSGVNRL